MLKDLRADRLRKFAKIKKAGFDPYPARVKRTHTLAEARRGFARLSKSRTSVHLVGRIMSIRDQGKVIFVDLRDETGHLQIVLKLDALTQFEFVKSVIDRGDVIGVKGTLFTTARGEQSVEARQVQMLAKSVNPWPTEWYGIEETELRLRKRYLDLALNTETKRLFETKSLFWDTLRNHLKDKGFTEVETPVLEAIPGGADAEPFITYMNALDADLYLRISLELPLKKLLVAGFEKVFEIGRVFRNEGISHEHLQDYTQLEFYWAYHDYHDLMMFVEDMYKKVIRKTCGGLVTKYQGHDIVWGRKWPRVEYTSLFKKMLGLDPVKATREELFAKALSFGLSPEKAVGKGRLIDLLYKKVVRPTLIQPTFLVNPPVEIEPLAKRCPGNPALVERAQVMACGTELGKGFSELNDPIEQRARFEEQMRLRAAGDKEAQMLDEEFLTALEYGMPPAAGFGLSERLFAVLMNKSIRECVFFPLMKPK